MIHIYQTDNPQNRISKDIKIVRKIIRNAYFANRIDEPEYEATETIYSVVAGDTLSKIATENSITVDEIKLLNGLNDNNIKVGQQLKLSSQKKKGDNVTFKYLNSAKVGETVYMVVETENAKGLNLKANIKQAVEKGIVDADQPLSILQDDNEAVVVKMQVGTFSSDQNIINKDDFKDKAIAKITLQPKDEKQLEGWNEKLEKLKGKKSRFYILIVADTHENDLVSYHGTNPEDIDKPPHEHKPQRWLDMEGKWFELKQCCIHGIEFKNEILCVSYSEKEDKNGNKIYWYGPKYLGNKKFSDYQNWDILIKDNKISKDEKEIFTIMAPNEGNFDSVQSYDRVALTAGAMQKTINNKGTGELARQIWEFKSEYPEVYNKNIKSCCKWSIEKTGKDKGWDGENGNYTLYYEKPDGTKITGDKLKEYIREGFNENTNKKKVKCLPLLPIINLIQTPEYMDKQVLDFKVRLDLVLEKTVEGYKIKQWIKTTLGRALVFDQHVNAPSNVVSSLKESINQFYQKKDKEINEFNKNKKAEEQQVKISQNPNDWGTAHADYEEEIIEHYGKNRIMNFALARYNNMKTRAKK